MAAKTMQTIQMTTVWLSGSLAQKFFRKRDYQIDTGKSWEVFSALKATIDGFAEELRRLDRLGLRFAIYRNRRNIGESELSLGGTREIRIVPVIGGSKRGGILQTVIGAIIIAIGAYTLQPGIVAAGVGIAAGGVIQMLSPQLKGLSQSGAPENMPSYAFGSARNTTASGSPVPICIGHRRWGGAIISASIYAEDKV